MLKYFTPWRSDRRFAFGVQAKLGARARDLSSIYPGISGISIMLWVNGRETLHHNSKFIFYGKYSLVLEIEVDAKTFV